MAWADRGHRHCLPRKVKVRPPWLCVIAAQAAIGEAGRPPAARHATSTARSGSARTSGALKLPALGFESCELCATTMDNGRLCDDGAEGSLTNLKGIGAKCSHENNSPTARTDLQQRCGTGC